MILPTFLALAVLALALAFATALRLRLRLHRASDELRRLRARLEAGPPERAGSGAPPPGAPGALEQLARQVAHDAAGPVTVVAANLRFVAQGLEDGTRPEELREALDEASQAMRQIHELVRELADSGLPPRQRP